MARLKTNILGGGSGKVGNVVMYERNGTACIRSMPSSYKDKKSDAQLRQRQKMNLIHQFLRPFKQLLHFTFFEANTGRSAYQSAQSYNLKQAISGDYPNQYLNKSKALLAKGSIEEPDHIQIEMEQNKAMITWSNESLPDGARWDDTLVVMWGNGQGEADYIFTGVRRSAGSYTINFSADRNMHMMDVWVAFRNWKETDWCNSICLTV